MTNRQLRILITGGRTFSDETLVRDALQELADECTHDGRFYPPVVVHGDAPGADRLVARIAREFDMLPEPHPARWNAPCRDTCQSGHRRHREDGSDYCPAAGNYRNQEMVDCGADLVLKFPGARGTEDCVRRARVAGIEVREITP